jgi:hypothetical protein
VVEAAWRCVALWACVDEEGLVEQPAAINAAAQTATRDFAGEAHLVTRSQWHARRRETVHARGGHGPDAIPSTDTTVHGRHVEPSLPALRHRRGTPVMSPETMHRVVYGFQRHHRRSAAQVAGAPVSPAPPTPFHHYAPSGTSHSPTGAAPSG